MLVRKVLVVDDDPFQRELLTAMLRDEGVSSVLSAEGGVQALKVIAHEGGALDLILCDLQMPDIDGVELLRHLADLGCRSPIALVSGEDISILTTAVTLARERGLYVVGGLAKPVERDVLRRLLSGEHRAERARASVQVTVEELTTALSEGQLELHYQPKMNLSDRRLAGAECLVRWRHPDKGMVPPDAFVPLAERHGLIDALTDRVLTLALGQAAAWRAVGIDVSLSVNLSMDNLRDPALVDRIRHAVADAGLEPAALVLEVTESRLVEDVMTAKEILTRLRLAGFALSIDDFGTGFSSLKQLQELPFTELKIDRAFVAGSARDVSRHAILEASARIGSRLGLKVVAEGVEDVDDWNSVVAVGCDQAQGWYISKPLPADDFERWVREHEADAE